MTQPTLILGGGIIGLTIAYNLQQRGVATVLIDANTVLGGASSGNAGHLAAEYNYPVANLATLAGPCALTGATCRASFPSAAAWSPT